MNACEFAVRGFTSHQFTVNFVSFFLFFVCSLLFFSFIYFLACKYCQCWYGIASFDRTSNHSNVINLIDVLCMHVPVYVCLFAYVRRCTKAKCTYSIFYFLFKRFRATVRCPHALSFRFCFPLFVCFFISTLYSVVVVARPLLSI